jgi:hypothetical protein
MSLLDDLGEAQSKNPHRSDCNMCAALDQMSPEEAEGVREVLAGRTIGTEKLAAILVNNGYPAGRRAIKRHLQEEHQ